MVIFLQEPHSEVPSTERQSMSTDSYISSAEFYDVIYTAMKDYKAESERAFAIAQEFSDAWSWPWPQTTRLLDVACGTGLHLEHFRMMFSHVEGLDLSENQLAIAKMRLPGVSLHRADMHNFSLGRKFEVITCMFSAIGYARTYQDLCNVANTIAKHLVPGGVVIIEPWILPEDWRDGEMHMQVIDTSELKLVRMNRSSSQGRMSVLDMHYLFLRRNDDAPTHFRERHLLMMHSKEEYLQALEQAGFNAYFVANDYRGYVVGVLPTLSY